MDRRNVMGFATAAAFLAASPIVRAATASQTFVLVHGAFHGGWCWARVAQLLRADGHQVFTPTFTGLGERAHFMSPNVDLNTFVRDIASVIESEELTNVVLVGHSYGGYVITGAADLVPDRIASLVYLDAGLLAGSGATVDAELTEEGRGARLRSAVVVNGTNIIMPPPATVFGVVQPDQVSWVNRQMKPMPLKAYTTPLVLKSSIYGVAPKTFIRCTKPAIAIPQVGSGARFAQANGWKYKEIATGHDAMVSAPQELTKMLLEG
ncbi:MAG: alpha/beta hydrolase [Pseudomonadota bacterium]